jgi:hypothetical protein
MKNPNRAVHRAVFSAVDGAVNGAVVDSSHPALADYLREVSPGAGVE